MNMRRELGLALAAALILLAVAKAATFAADETPAKAATGATAADATAETAPKFSEAYLNDPAHIQAGSDVWHDQCRHCHGKSAYPGKAPKLRPRRYTPDFVFDRVTNGFRKMPAWKEIYSQEERMAVVAYILSKNFSP